MRPATRWLVAAVSTLAVTACDDVTLPDITDDAEPFGTVVAQLLLDADGSGSPNSGDEPLEGWTLRIDQPAGGTLATGTTDSDGIVRFDNVPVGRFVLAVDEDRLGDTLVALDDDVEPVLLAAGAEVAASLQLSYPTFSLAEVRELPADRPLFTVGVALNTLPPNARTVHLKDGADYLRVLSIGDGAVFPGDSIRIRGRTAVDAGVPVLDGGPFVQVGLVRPVPSAIGLSTGQAADALGGELDAALVTVRDADILEVEDDGADVTLVVNDGSGRVTIRLGEFFGMSADDFDPATDRLSRARGLLVPVLGADGVSWELRPRAAGDLEVG